MAVVTSVVCGGGGKEPEDSIESKGVRLQPNEIVQSYILFEQALLERLDSQLQGVDNGGKVELKETIQALARIRSLKAVPKLLKILTFSPQQVVFPGGDELMLAGPLLDSDRYPVFDALIHIGLPFNTCIYELQKTKEGSMREKLLAKIGFQIYGPIFADHIQRRATGIEPERQKRILEILKPLMSH